MINARRIKPYNNKTLMFCNAVLGVGLQKVGGGGGVKKIIF